MNEEDQIKANELYAFAREFAERKLADENERENSLIQQAGTMQAVFSFMTAALFVIAQIVIDQRGKLSLEFLLLAFSIITITLLCSLLYAALAQRRKVITTFPDVDEFLESVKNNYTEYLIPAQRDKAMAELIADIQKSKNEANNERVECVCKSMSCFYIAVVMSVIFFVIGLIILYI